MKLHEIMNRGSTYEVIRATPGGFRTQKDVGDHTLVFVASLAEDSDSVWEIAFFDKQGAKLSTEPTGSFKAGEVLGFVGSSLEEFVARYAPAVMTYSISKDEYGDKRDAVYERLFKKFAPGYQRAKQEGDAGSDKYVAYIDKNLKIDDPTER